MMNTIPYCCHTIYWLTSPRNNLERKAASPEKHLPTPYRCKECQKLGHTEKYCTQEQNCPICSSKHEGMSNCQNPPNCANCKGHHLAALHHVHTSSTRGYQENPQLDTRPSSRVLIVCPTAKQQRETQIYQIETIQLEMVSLKELKQIRPLQEKVTSLGSTVDTFQKSLIKLENGQYIANNKQDQLVDLMSHILPEIEGNNVEMDKPKAVDPMKTASVNVQKNLQEPAKPKKIR